ncbi:hypothetical protein [Candidatus Phytoplasma prunorum]|uniref:hypothetical protein n=1 Tax=Candidatus Phytoplasma prunorum TaxID=47565 RepID=UPI002FF05612
MWEQIINSFRFGLTKLNQSLQWAGSYIGDYNQICNILLLAVILLFIPQILTLLETILKGIFHIGHFIYLIMESIVIILWQPGKLIRAFFKSKAEKKALKTEKEKQ